MLFNFYNSHYSANLMKLVVYGQEDIENLVKSVEEKFRDVKNNKFAKFAIKEHPFGEDAIGKIIKLVPVKDRRVLELTWLIKDQSPYYRNAPSKYVSHIIGHEGKGSLLSYLISQGLATALSAGGSDSYSCYSEIEVTITLTDKGVAQVRDVIGYVFYFIQMLKEKEPQEWVISEIKRINKIKFDFLEKKQGMSFCSNIAKALHKRKVEETFIYPYLMEEFKPDLIKAYLEQLTNDNLLVMIESKTYEPICTQVEPIYQSKFITEPFGDIQPIPCDVSLPEHNTFIPDDLTVLPLGS
jgi:insulysin